MERLYYAIKARMMFKSLGGKVAAGFLRRRGFSFEEAILALGLKLRPEAS